MKLTRAPFAKSAFCLLALFAWSTASVSAQATFTERTKDNRGDATISGKAVYNDTDKPIRRVRVLLVPQNVEQREVRTAGTDGNGEFTFKNVVAGDYRIVVDFAGRVNGSPNINKDVGTPVSVAASSSAEVRNRALSCASISGQVGYPG